MNKYKATSYTCITSGQNKARCGPLVFWFTKQLLFWNKSDSPLQFDSCVRSDSYEQSCRRLFPSLMLLLSMLLTSLQAYGSEDIVDAKTKLSGFGSIGLTKSGTDILGFRKDIAREALYDGEYSFSPDSLMAFQVDSELTTNWALSGQIVLRDRYQPFMRRSDLLERSYLRYRYDASFNMRMGRIGTDVFLLSEYRNVGYSLPWVRAPIEVYGAIPFDFIDGVDATISYPYKGGYFDLKLYAGEVDFNSPAREMRSVRDNVFYGLNLGWESLEWRARLSLSRLKWKTSIFDVIESGRQLETTLEQAVIFGWPNAALILKDNEIINSHTNRIGLGLEYNLLDWQVRSELAYIANERLISQDSISGYLSVSYQQNNISPYIILSGSAGTNELPVYTPPAPAPFQPLEALIRQMNQSSWIHQTNISLGVKWDLMPKVAVKMQIDRTWVREGHSGLWASQDWILKDQTLDSFAINLSYIF